MRNSIGAKKDFMELSFISALLLGLSLVSACSSLVAETKTISGTPSAYAETLGKSTSSASSVLYSDKGGKNEFRN